MIPAGPRCAHPLVRLLVEAGGDTVAVDCKKRSPGDVIGKEYSCDWPLKSVVLEPLVVSQPFEVGALELVGVCEMSRTGRQICAA